MALIPYRLLPLRHRLWLKALARALRTPGGAARREAVSRALGAHPWSWRVRGGGSGEGSGEGRQGERLRVAFFLLPSCWDEFTIPLIQLGEALRRRGLEIEYWGGAAGHCSFFGSAKEPWSEADCEARFEVLNRRMLAGMAPFRALNERRSEALAAEARRWREGVMERPLAELEYEGTAAWECIKGSLARLSGEPPVLAAGERVADRPETHELLEGLVINHGVLTEWLEEQRPDVVMLFSGLFYLGRQLGALARARGVRVIAYENSCFANRRIFDTSGVIGNETSVARETWPMVRERELTAAQSRRLDGFLAEVWAGKNSKIGQAGAERGEALRARLGLEAGRPLALLLGQVPIDTVICYDLRGFESSLAFIRAVIEHFGARPEWDLVVRLHPLEAMKFGDRTWRALREEGVPGNVRLVHGQEANTYALMDEARLGITSTSQAGLEMLAKEKPVVLAGKAFYGGKGFTGEIERAEELGRALDAAMATPRLSEEQRRQVRSFLYHVIFEHQVAYDPENQLFPPEGVDRVEAMIRRGAVVRLDEERDEEAAAGR